MGLHWALLLVSVGAGWERAHGASAARAPVGAAELLWQSRSHCAGQAPADRPNDLIWFAEEAGAEVRHSRRAGGDPIDGGLAWMRGLPVVSADSFSICVC
jgi:hypothetical protein